MAKNDHDRTEDIMTAVLWVLLALVVTGITPIVNAQRSDNPGAASIGSKHYGLTFGDWTAKWWQWLLSIPKDSNPAGDMTGKNCAQNQEGPVWFLAGTFGGSAERACTIPAGKAVMFPVLAAECSFTEYPALKTEADLRNCAKPLADVITDMVVTVDGANFQNLEQYRAQSPLFNFSFPSSNVYGVQPGPSHAVSDGYFIFLSPLPAGTHQIRFGAAVIGLTTANIPTTNFATDATYHVIAR